MSFMAHYLYASQTMTCWIWPNVCYKLCNCHEHYYSMSFMNEGKDMMRLDGALQWGGVDGKQTWVGVIASPTCGWYFLKNVNAYCVLHLADSCWNMNALWARPSLEVLADWNTFQSAYSLNIFLSRWDFQMQISFLKGRFHWKTSLLSAVMRHLGCKLAWLKC